MSDWLCCWTRKEKIMLKLIIYWKRDEKTRRGKPQPHHSARAERTIDRISKLKAKTYGKALEPKKRGKHQHHLVTYSERHAGRFFTRCWTSLKRFFHSIFFSSSGAGRILRGMRERTKKRTIYSSAPMRYSSSVLACLASWATIALRNTILCKLIVFFCEKMQKKVARHRDATCLFSSSAFIVSYSTARFVVFNIFEFVLHALDESYIFFLSLFEKTLLFFS